MTSTTLKLALSAAAMFLTSAAAAQPDLERIKQSLVARLPDAAMGELAPTPIEGVYELSLPGQVFYVSGDGRYLINGRLLDLEQREDLTERVLAEQRLSVLGEVAESRMIVFDAKGERRHTITTFTDIDCPYCRKMHAEMDQLNASGIRVRYLLYPRAGIPSESYDKAVSVWCAPDQQAEMTSAKRGVIPERRDCSTPIEEHMAVAKRLGLRGTPFTITETGRVISGYVPAQRLFDSLGTDKSSRTR